MSYELSLFGPDVFERIRQWASDRPRFELETEGYLHYANPVTGVMFSLEAKGADEAALGINYVRPCFFGDECAAELASLEELGLEALDPRDDSGERQPLSLDAMRQSWAAGNRWATRSATSFGPRPWMPESDAVAMWTYLYRTRPALAAEHGESIHVPVLSVLRLGEDPRVARHATLPGPDAVVVPPCDVLTLERESGGMLVSRPEAMLALGRALDATVSPHELQVLSHGADDCQRWDQVQGLWALPIETRSVPTDRFLTIPDDEATG